MSFDANAHRDASLQAWEEAAAGWVRSQELLREFGAPVSHWLIDAVAPQPGQRVLELAAGLGETGLLAAELVAPVGGAVISDQAEAMLTGARERAAALARSGEHRLGLVGDDRAADGRDELGREQPRLAQSGGELEHALAGLRGHGVDQPVRHGRAELAQQLLAANPAGGRLFPGLQAGVAVRVGVKAHRRSRRSSLPERVRGSGSPRSSTRLGTL